MKTLPLFVAAALALVPVTRAEDYVSLFDGKTFAGWAGAEGSKPGEGWSISDGELRLDGKGGNLFSEKEYSDFDLEWEWKLAE